MQKLRLNLRSLFPLIPKPLTLGALILFASSAIYGQDHGLLSTTVVQVYEKLRDHDENTLVTSLDDFRDIALEDQLIVARLLEMAEAPSALYAYRILAESTKGSESRTARLAMVRMLIARGDSAGARLYLTPLLREDGAHQQELAWLTYRLFLEEGNEVSAQSVLTTIETQYPDDPRLNLRIHPREQALRVAATFVWNEQQSITTEPASTPRDRDFQLGAFRHMASAQRLVDQLPTQLDAMVRIDEEDSKRGFFKVMVRGPEQEVRALLDEQGLDFFIVD